MTTSGTATHDGPGAAFDSFLADVAPSSRTQERWTAGDAPLPALFLGHGAPPLFDDAKWIAQLFAWSTSLPKPRAILMVSAHWEAAPMSLSSPAAGTGLIYDFGGFAARYYNMTYPTPDASELAREVTGLLPASESVHTHPSRGLDHGAWVPLKVMYPFGDVPVLQLSLPTHDPEQLLELGRRLRPLRDSGVLIIGSGFLTHGLPFLTPEMFFGGAVPGWSRDFDGWAADALARGAVDELMDYRRAPGMPYAHPSPEHFSPIFVTLGAAEQTDAEPDTAIDGYAFGLAKRSFQVQ